MSSGAYYNFQRLALWSEVLGYIIAFVVFLGIIKIIYILRFNRRMSLLASTLKNAGKEMRTFSVVFFITISAYSQLAYVVFGSHLASYNNFMTTLESLLSLLLGSFDYEELATANPYLGPFFFFSFILLMVFMLTNMFVSIINDTFSAVKEDVNLQSNEYELLDFMLGRFEAMTGLKLTGSSQQAQEKYLQGECSNLMR